MARRKVDRTNLDPTIPEGRRLRLRVDQYHPDDRAYRPSLGQAVRLTVSNLAEQHALFRSLIRWGKRRDWLKDIDPTETHEPGRGGR